MTFNEKLDELAMQIKEITFLKLAEEAGVELPDNIKDKFLDCNNRDASKAMTDLVINSVKNTIAPFVLAQEELYKKHRTNIVHSLDTGLKYYKFFIGGVEVYTTGEMYSYRGDYYTLAIEYTRDKMNHNTLTAKDFPFEGELFESHKSGEVPINRVSKFTLVEGEANVSYLNFNRVEYDRDKKEARYYFDEQTTKPTVN